MLLFTAAYTGIDEEGIHDAEDDDDDDADMANVDESESGSRGEKESVDEGLADEEAEELEEARRERVELMAAEREAIAQDEGGGDEPDSKLQYLLAQSEVFAHFLAGEFLQQNPWRQVSSFPDAFESDSRRIESLNSKPSCSYPDKLFVLFAPEGSLASTSKRDKRKKGKSSGRSGKKGRMSEAEEDARLLKSAQSKRRTVRLDKQPSNLAKHCKMHGYQLEGLNWMIKLHDNGINGILVSVLFASIYFGRSCGPCINLSVRTSSPITLPFYHFSYVG